MTAVLTDTELEQDKNSHEARLDILVENFLDAESTKNTLKMAQLLGMYPEA